MNLPEELKALKQRISELEELAKEEQEFPQKDDEYWYIKHEGGVFKTYYGHYIDACRQTIGNIFRTEEEAEFAVEKLKVEAELRKYSTPFKNGEYNHYMFFDTESYLIEFGVKRCCKSQGAIYFESEERAQEAIEIIGEERVKKYIFGVED